MCVIWLRCDEQRVHCCVATFVDVQHLQHRSTILFLSSSCSLFYSDSSFVGAVEKDSAELQAEHKSLFETANAKELNKKVVYL